MKMEGENECESRGLYRLTYMIMNVVQMSIGIKGTYQVKQGSMLLSNALGSRG